ncbi:hypothetical protein NECAME_05579 [Necator americanus]|uniref:Uncharacterized protein n=1 Tax=Necator americanus TaxID=51031 RepID=W2SHZ2_NECAM|nr:hypothetical protein NECAME_05579 [Necator americanus]ETN68496.1 hypothetical protein NECAME_05579 [Necator americanus]
MLIKELDYMGQSSRPLISLNWIPDEKPPLEIFVSAVHGAFLASRTDPFVSCQFVVFFVFATHDTNGGCCLFRSRKEREHVRLVHVHAPFAVHERTVNLERDQAGPGCVHGLVCDQILLLEKNCSPQNLVRLAYPVEEIESVETDAENRLATEKLKMRLQTPDTCDICYYEPPNLKYILRFGFKCVFY